MGCFIKTQKMSLSVNNVARKCITIQMCIVVMIVTRSTASTINDVEETAQDPFSLQSENRNTYVDPFDMLNYDPVFKSAKDIKDKSIEAVVAQDAVRRENEGTSPGPVTEPQPRERCNEVPEMFLKRFIRVLYSTLDLENHNINSGETLLIDLVARVSKEDKELLRLFMSDTSQIKYAELDEVMSRLFEVVQKEDTFPTEPLIAVRDFFRDFYLHPKDILGIMFVALTCAAFVMMLRGYSLRYVLVSFISLGFMVDVYFNWNHMHQLAQAKRQSDESKMSSLPRYCQPDKLNWYELVWSKLPGKDPCEKYHEILYTETVYSVSLMQAFSESFARLVFHPLEYVGNRVGSFFAGVLQTNWWFERYIILFIVLVLLLVLLAFVFRYQLTFPFWLGSIGPSPEIVTRTQIVDSKPHLEVIEELRKEIQSLKLSSTVATSPQPQQPAVVMVRLGSEARLQRDTPGGQDSIQELWKAIHEIRTNQVTSNPDSMQSLTDGDSRLQVVERIQAVTMTTENDAENFEILDLTETLKGTTSQESS